MPTETVISGLTWIGTLSETKERMRHENDIVIIRPAGSDGIALEEWLALVSASTAVRLVPPRTGIIPFTKEPIEFKPAAGSAYFDTSVGRCCGYI